MNISDINRITNQFGGFTLEDYFHTSGNQYVIYIIDYENQQFIFQDGIVDENLEEMCKDSFLFQRNGISALYGQLSVDGVKSPIDVFMVDKNLTECCDVELLELIIFHEVCHLLEKTEYYKALNLILTKHQTDVGSMLKSIADKIDDQTGGFGDDEHHNALFGGILFHFLEKYDIARCYELLGKAMIKNFGDDYSSTFRKV